MDVHRIEVLKRARELSTSIARINFRDPRMQNWEMYMKQLQMINNQLYTLSLAVYGDSFNAAVSTRALEASMVFVPLVDSFQVEAMLPARPDQDIATRDAEIITNALRQQPAVDLSSSAAATAEAAKLVEFDSKCLELMSLPTPIDSPPIQGLPSSSEGRLTVDSVDPSVLCSMMFSGNELRLEL
jgi:hypothetical protein